MSLEDVIERQADNRDEPHKWVGVYNGILAERARFRLNGFRSLAPLAAAS